MDRIEIKNATIIDGLGGDPYVGNLYLNDGKIIAITHDENLDSDISIDATGKTVDAEADSYQIAYTMGGATFSVAEVDVDNAGYSAGSKEATVVQLGLAF